MITAVVNRGSPTCQSLEFRALQCQLINARIFNQAFWTCIGWMPLCLRQYTHFRESVFLYFYLWTSKVFDKLYIFYQFDSCFSKLLGFCVWCSTEVVFLILMLNFEFPWRLQLLWSSHWLTDFNRTSLVKSVKILLYLTITSRIF